MTTNKSTTQLQNFYTSVDGLGLGTCSRLSMFARTSVETSPKNAPVIILVHGLVLSSRYMVPTAELLASNYRVYAPDLPGYGNSDKPDSVLELPELADILCRWMDAVGLDEATFLGNSMGCQIIAELAMRHPDRIERAILQGPTVDPKARSFLEQLWRFILNAPGEDYSIAPIEIIDYWLAGLPRAFRTVEIALNDRIEDKLPYLRVPTLIVRGENDPVVPQRWVEEILTFVPQAQLKIIPGAAHTLNYSHPQQLSEAVSTFIKAT